ncbi:MAG: hypothetical protein RIG61_10685 [Deltaproteobacteria bacterium]
MRRLFLSRYKASRKIIFSDKLKFFLAAFVLFYLFILAQEARAVGGISNSKVVVPSTDTVPKKHVEVEPFFSFEFVDDRDNTFRFGGGVRLTLGALDNLELGANVNYLDHEDANLIQSDTNFGVIETGVKFRFLNQSEEFPFSLAYQGGVTFPTGGDSVWIVEPGGLILTKNFTDRFSMDADFVFGIIENDAWSFVTEVGFGYYLNSWFQPVLEGAFGYEDARGEESVSLINITAGFTAAATDWLTVIIGVTPEVYTENKDKEVIITSAFTFLF